jgi:transmembrane sensor
VTAPDDISPELSPLQKEAFAWVIRLHSGAATTEDAEAIARWRQTSPEHEEAFRDAVRIWRRVGDAARNYADGSDAVEARSVLAYSQDLLLSRRGLLGGAVAASLATYFVMRPPFDLWPSYRELSADYRTSKGERRDIALSPNVSLKLNTQTSIAVHATKDDSQIELISGEAVITSTRQAARPLIVTAGNGRITAAQAQYNARCLDGNVAVSCLDGAVAIETDYGSQNLPKGQQVSYGPAGLGAPRALDEETTAWERGLLIVHDWPLDEVVREVNRYRPGKIVVMNSRLGRRIITGTFHLDQLNDFIGQVHGLLGVSVQSLPGGLVILS